MSGVQKRVHALAPKGANSQFSNEVRTLLRGLDKLPRVNRETIVGEMLRFSTPQWRDVVGLYINVILKP